MTVSTTVFEEASLPSDSNNWDGFNMRQSIGAATFLPPASPTPDQIRIKFVGDSAEGLTLTSVYVGHAASPGSFDFDGNQVQLLFSASATGNVPSGGDLESDDVAFDFDPSKDLVVAMYVGSTPDRFATIGTLANCSGNFKSGSDESSDTTVTGYSATADDLYGVSEITVTGPGAGGADTFIASVFAAAETRNAATSRARINTAAVLVEYQESVRQVVASEIQTLVEYQTYVRQVVQAEGYLLAEINATANGGFSTVPRMTQHATLVEYGLGVPDKSRSRAWTYDLDGHAFYVLDLGEEGTWLYDFVTQTWSQFETTGYEGLWNALQGVYWAARRSTIVSDRVNSYLHEIDAAQPLDEGWRPITMTVTGGLASRNRPHYPQDSFRITGSVGQLADPDGVGISMRFRFSDDQAKTWRATYELALTPDDFDQEIAWRSLGTIRAPGRIFEIRDQGGLLRIDTANAEVGGLEDDAD